MHDPTPLAHLWAWIAVHLSQETGTSNEASRAYAFWSGFGSDLGEVTLIAVYHHHRCASCPRIALHHKVPDTGQRMCNKHATHENQDRLRARHRAKYPDHIAHTEEPT